MSSKQGWVGVDLDGTLAIYDGWQGPTHIGAPVPLMVERIKAWVAQAQEVRIFTARVSTPDAEERRSIVEAVHAWLLAQGLPELRVTCIKDFQMVSLYDDRAVQVEFNTGRIFNGIV